MPALLDLWFPILLSAVFVFIASSVLHMVLPIHKSDMKQLPGEGDVLEAMRSQSVTPGEYMFPCPADMKDMESPEFIAKQEQGPVGFMVVVPNGPYGMGKALLQWFVYSIVVAAFVAHIASFSLDPGASFKAVFHVTASLAILAHAVAQVPNAIWKGVSWTTTGKFVFDGLIYGVVTGLAFGWLWPGAIQ
jgi:hypothetical protein